MSSPITVHAAAAEFDFSASDLPNNLQWMPPGKRMVQPMNFPEPFEIEVTPAMAAKADEQLQAMRADFAAGRDVEPYLDINHKDEVKAFIPERIVWGGDDEKTGGIRVLGKWNAAGVRAAKDEGLNVLSPSWALDKFTKAFLGIKRNLGGLVPRSAFHSIQAFAKAGDDTAPAPQEEHAFVVSARVYAQQNGIGSETEAQAKFCSTPVGQSLYTQYRHWLRSQPPIEAKAKPASASRPADSEFVVQAKAFGAVHGITDECEAQTAFASTAQGRSLYEAYCKALC